ncbi:hypothetical protein DV736_g3693, partial [Chaetothyriales sp. CBS 134916]
MTGMPGATIPADSVADKDNTSGSDVLTETAEDKVRNMSDQTLWPNNNSESEKGMIFSTLLREWGAPNIGVQEVLELDGLFNAKAESMYGLILLSRWAPSETENELSEAPTSVWFANQVQSFSCATVSLMNIIMNRPELDLGEELNAFRALTQPLDPLERGWQLDRNDKIRDIHNSFGTDIDKAKVDYKLQQDYDEAERRKKQAARRGKKRRGKARRKKKEREEDGGIEENGFHFIAYVPVAGAVWKMDGMEKLPRKLGEITAGGTWLCPVLAEVMKMRETAAVNQFEVSLLSLVERVDDSGVGAEVKQMEEARQDWGPLLTTLLKLHSQRGDLKEVMGVN